MGCDLTRNLDISALRSFVAVADLGGMTRAAGKLNLTQSAVSMQVKRLESVFDVSLVERVGRGVALTSEGQQLLGYCRQILRLNDEAWQRLTHEAFEGQGTFGVPEDLVFPIVPSIMREFAAAFPRASVRLLSSQTRTLKEKLAEGSVDIILTTEPRSQPASGRPSPARAHLNPNFASTAPMARFATWSPEACANSTSMARRRET